MKFKFLFLLTLIFVFCGLGNLSGHVYAQSTASAQNQALIAQLNQQVTQTEQSLVQAINQQQGTSLWCYTFKNKLGFAQSGTNDVVQLHLALMLNLSSPSLSPDISYSPDDINTYSLGTSQAVIAFQKKYGIIPQSGYVGRKTIAELNTLYGCPPSSSSGASSLPLTGIAITTPAAKLSYTVGDSLDLTGLVVTGTYGDGSKQVETISNSDISGFDSSSPKTSETLTITYGDQTASYIVSINPAYVAGGGGGTSGATQILISSIAVSDADSGTVVNGNTDQMIAVVSPSNATNKTVTWSSSNTSVATINSSTGLLTAMNPGSVTVTATATDGSGVTGTEQITVNPNTGGVATTIPVTSITLTGANSATAINSGQTLQMSASVLPANATNQTVTWSASQPAQIIGGSGTNVATIDQTGLLTAGDPGTVTVTATANDGSGVSGSEQITVGQSLPSNNCVPDWTCKTTPCTNGHQSQYPFDNNNCGVQPTGGAISCPDIMSTCGFLPPGGITHPIMAPLSSSITLQDELASISAALTEIERQIQILLGH
jgi:uncharacterized protein YjdB